MKKQNKIIFILLSIMGLILFSGLQTGAATFEGLNDELKKQAVEPSSSENNSVNASPQVNDSFKVGVVLQSLLRIVVVLIVIVVAIWFTGRYLRNKFSSRLQGRWLKVVDEVVLGQNRGVVLCKIEDKIFALGITEQQINYLFTVDDELLTREIDHQIENGFSETQSSISQSMPKTGWVATIKRWFSSGQPKKSKNFHALVQKNLDRVSPLTFEEEREENNNDAIKK